MEGIEEVGSADKDLGTGKDQVYGCWGPSSRQWYMLFFSSGWRYE